MTASQPSQFGAYEDNGVLVAGWTFAEPFEGLRTVIVQLERADSDQRQDGWGPHLERDGVGAYGCIARLEDDPGRGQFRIALAEPPGAVLSLPVPASASDEGRRVLADLALEHRGFLAAREAGRGA